MPHRSHHCLTRVAFGIALALLAGVALPGCTQSRADEIVDESWAPVTEATVPSVTAGPTTTSAPAEGPNWPTQWASRKLFNRPTAFIYAASVSAAREAEQIMLDATRDFLEFTGAKASKGLIIVTDAKDPLPADEVQLAQIISNRLRSYRTATQPSIEPTVSDPDVEWAKQKKKFDDAGLPIGALLRILPCGVLKDDLTAKLGLPTNVALQTPWAAIVPTRAACKRSAHELTKAIMKSKEVTIGQRLLMAPWMPMMESMMTDELAAERVVTLFNEDALSRADWDPTRKQAYIGDYRETKNRERDKRISSREKEMKASRAATSQPGEIVK